MMLSFTAFWTVTPRGLVASHSGICYQERCYNERMPQQTVFINKVRMLQRRQILQRTRRNTIGRRSTRMRITCSIIVFIRERLFMLLTYVRLFMVLIRESLFIVFTKESLFVLFKFTCTVYKSKIN